MPDKTPVDYTGISAREFFFSQGNEHLLPSVKPGKNLGSKIQAGIPDRAPCLPMLPFQLSISGHKWSCTQAGKCSQSYDFIGMAHKNKIGSRRHARLPLPNLWYWNHNIISGLCQNHAGFFKSNPFQVSLVPSTWRSK